MPTELVAKTCPTYVPAYAFVPCGRRPSQTTDCAPAGERDRRQRAHDDAGLRLDLQPHLCARESVKRNARAPARELRRRERLQRRVVPERAVDRRVPPQVVDRLHVPVPRPLDVVVRERERVRAGLLARRPPRARAARCRGRSAARSPSTAGRSCSRAARPRGPGRRSARQRRLRREDAEVLHEQRLLDRRALRPGRSAGSAAARRTRPSTDAPESTAEAVTAPSRCNVCASSKLVRPTL